LEGVEECSGVEVGMVAANRRLEGLTQRPAGVLAGGQREQGAQGVALAVQPVAG
jgi:hypothetical protein